MRYLLALTICATVACSAHAQLPALYSGEVVAVGPYRPMVYSPGWQYVNPSGYYPAYGGGYGWRRYAVEEQLYETRRIRRAVESRSWYRGGR
jgi:hypothetical protein